MFPYRDVFPEEGREEERELLDELLLRVDAARVDLADACPWRAAQAGTGRC